MDEYLGGKANPYIPHPPFWRVRLIPGNYRTFRLTSEWHPRNGVLRSAVKAVALAFGAEVYLSGRRWFRIR